LARRARTVGVGPDGQPEDSGSDEDRGSDAQRVRSRHAYGLIGRSPADIASGIRKDLREIRSSAV
jgi:hypothetical protein